MKAKLTALHIIFISVLLLFTYGSFGQNPIRQLKWEPWESHPCMQGISTSVMEMGFSKEAGGYLWGIRFRNDYNIPVSFEYKLAIGEESKSKQGFLSVYKLEPGKIMTDGNDLFTGKFYNNPSSEYFIYTNKFCFDGMKFFLPGVSPPVNFPAHVCREWVSVQTGDIGPYVMQASIV